MLILIHEQNVFIHVNIFYTHLLKISHAGAYQFTFGSIK